MLSNPVPADAQASSSTTSTGTHPALDAARGHAEAANDTLDGTSRAEFGARLAERFLMDQRFYTLPARSLGVYVMLRANADYGHPVPACLREASKMLRSSQAVCESAIKDLMATRPALVVQRDGFLIPMPFGVTLRTGNGGFKPIRKKAAAAQELPDEKRAAAARSKLDATKKVSRASKPRPGVTLASLPRSEVLPQDLIPAPNPDLLSVSATPINTTGDLFGEDAPRPAPARVLDCPYAEIGALFSNLCGTLKKVGPVQTWPHARKRNLLERWKRCPDLTFWKSFFELVAASDWLMGRSGKNWVASFDWIIGPKNFQKIVENNYANSGTTRRSLFNHGAPLTAAAYGGHEIPDDAPWMGGSSKDEA